jgi:predicted cobalt transporter CbtA
MSDSWVSILLGWPAILIAFSIAILGIVRRKPMALIASVILVLPISPYLFGAPKVSWLALLIPVFFIGVGVAIRFRRYRIA